MKFIGMALIATSAIKVNEYPADIEHEWANDSRPAGWSLTPYTPEQYAIDIKRDKWKVMRNDTHLDFSLNSGDTEPRSHSNYMTFAQSN